MTMEVKKEKMNSRKKKIEAIAITAILAISLIAVFSLVAIPSVQANPDTTYYVNATSGDDT
ncbi:hypothetical protein C5S30_06955 [ANME-1 cluster archaeon GoMg4]|nr:hypothetical protein [ANME-1 cluster archaeon GoMg4]